MKHTEENYRMYFGHKADYYLNAVRQISSGDKIKFNVAAFFFGFLWMLYRKMYFPALIIFLFILLESWIEESILIMLSAPDYVYSISNIVMTGIFSTLIGIFANYIYIGQVDRKISKILSNNLTEEETNQKIMKSGGTTYLPFIVVIILIIIVVFLGQQGWLC